MILKGRPLSRVLGPSDHAEYRGLIQAIADRAWIELEVGTENVAPKLSVIDGGKKE
jgi:hypothetical protein